MQYGLFRRQSLKSVTPQVHSFSDTSLRVCFGVSSGAFSKTVHGVCRNNSRGRSSARDAAFLKNWEVANCRRASLEPKIQKQKNGFSS